MFSHLNPEQQKAVLATRGKVLILAGAGSGKTSVLAYRMAYMLKNLQIPPEAILGLTFTNKAAQEMKERVGKIVSKAVAKKVTLSTFHSFCMQVLRKEIHHLGYETNFTIYDSDEQLTLVKKIMKDNGYDTKQIAPSLVHWQISKAKNELKTPGQVAAESSDALSEVVTIVYPKYQADLQTNNALDFDDLIMKTVELFKQYPQAIVRRID